MLVKFSNVATGRYLDLHCALREDGTRINCTPNTNDYTPLGPQIWKLQCQDHARQYFTIKNAQSGTFASAPRVAEGAYFVGTRAEQTLEILEVAEGIVKIKALDSDLIVSGDGEGVVTLQRNRESDHQQEWAIIRFSDVTVIEPFILG